MYITKLYKGHLVRKQLFGPFQVCIRSHIFETSSWKTMRNFIDNNL